MIKYIVNKFSILYRVHNIFHYFISCMSTLPKKYCLNSQFGYPVHEKKFIL